MNYNPDVLTCLANLSNDEVFTPPDIANQMLDTLPQELFSNPDAKFLDPFSKSGVFLREIAKRLLKGLEPQISDLQERIDHIMHHQLYGIGITELTAYLSRRSLYCSTRANGKHSVTHFENENGNIYFKELPHSWDKNGKCTYCGATEREFSEDQREGLAQHAYNFIHNDNPYQDMQFDVIIGNPPYQISDGGHKASAMPIYHLFIQQAIKLNPHYLCMIVPSRWFAGGKGLDDFRDEMLKDRRIKEIHDYPISEDVFPGVGIAGGINYFLWESDYNGDCLIKTYEEGKVVSEMQRPLKEEGNEIFIRYNEAIPILRKVQNFKEKSFAEVISSRKPFGLSTNIKGNTKPYKDEDNIVLYQNGGTAYYKRNEVPQNTQWIDAHKVYISYAYGIMNVFPNQVFNKPFYGEPNSACTETYLVIGPFRDKTRCENVVSYMKTRFFRFLILLKKNTQHATKRVYEFVPMQDFSKPWTDEELYAKYGLTEEEIAYIEKMVRPME
ncbi:restriction endonuclease [Capnocytophaga canimorsus]|uniref:site-specific DNA-methyltransferase (adenine-specific) n=1 Tax=Capnocytophaga canimorsus TaxID=28188 RepID=A0A250G3R8_9FLAO|nr:Eco57I restriction-modification methylase domain-containing protein [Capnocytophaga canimorsus]ATA90827.1 restriction endonuclease [Capnocytophaga canimorsus]